MNEILTLRSPFAISAALWFSLSAVLTVSAAETVASPKTIKNPFYRTAQWRLWHLDQQPVAAGEKILVPAPPADRLYPDNKAPSPASSQFLIYRQGDWPERKYAGIWDDVYASLDGKHSYLPVKWTDGQGNMVMLRGQHMDLVLSPETGSVSKLGLTFTSQSTTGMGHDLTDSQADIDTLERYFCFANILRAGPAHVSFGEHQLDRIDDRYDAIVPCFYNSAGSSGSEVNALAKMMIAGGHLPTATKYRLKENGLYIPVLLYIWKAALPYDVPYTNELRHRVAYASSGRPDDRRLVRQVELNQVYHRYDESRHLKNMLGLARSMQNTPPIALFQSVEVEGGSVESVNRTAIRIHQRRGRPVRIKVSAGASFDLDDRPLKFTWTPLYANTGVEIEPGEFRHEAVITVPFAANLPKGRTVIMLTVDNGIYASNPAMINVYRPFGKANLRPSLSGLADTTVLSGATVRFDIESEDPEHFPVTLYRWANEVGELKGRTFKWKTPRSTEPLEALVSIIASDGTSSFNSAQATITVTPTLATFKAGRAEGAAPLAVGFSSAGSRDIDGNALGYSWDFDDGSLSSEANPTHIFTAPGFHQVTLTVSGPHGQHSASRVIRVKAHWPKAIDNGWTRAGIDESIWSIDGPVAVSVERGADFRLVLGLEPDRKAPRDTPVTLTSAGSFAPPLMIEATFKRRSQRRGTGIEILGTLIGNLESPRSSDTSIGRRKDDETWIFEPITHALSRPQTPSTLVVYVTADPNHPGRIRYTGRLDTPLESRYFRFDDQVPSGDKIRILTKSRGGRFEISEFAVFAPGDATGGG